MSIQSSSVEDYHHHQLQQRENDINELLLEWKEQVLNHSKMMVDMHWSKIRNLVLCNGIKCSDKEAIIITEDVIATSKNCAHFNADRTIKYLNWAYDFYFPETRMEDIRKDFVETLWGKMSLSYKQMDELRLKDIMSLVSANFYDGIALLFTNHQKPSLDEE